MDEDLKKTKNLELFESAPVPEAVFKNSAPAMMAMLMVLVYCLADTFFIGQTGDPLLVSAVSLATPVFLLFMSAGTIFGIGGTSEISRALGEKRIEYARNVCAFCFYGCITVGLALTAIYLSSLDTILSLIGASAETWESTKSYLCITSFGGVFVLISNCFSNILRAEGQPNRAMFGQVFGNMLNVVLDPMLILYWNMGIDGAAIATVIGSVSAAIYYIYFFVSGKSILSIRWKDSSLNVAKGVLSIGIPTALGSSLMSISHIVGNAEMAKYGDLAVAGCGVAGKSMLITGMVCFGLGQGVQPILGYCIGARLKERFSSVIRFSLKISFFISFSMALLCFVFAEQIVGSFLSDASAFSIGVEFTHILLSTGMFIGPFFILLGTIQAAGAARAALIINVSRQGFIYIPSIFILEPILGRNGIVWAQPLADVLAIGLVVYLYRLCVNESFR